MGASENGCASEDYSGRKTQLVTETATECLPVLSHLLLVHLKGKSTLASAE